MNKLILVDSDNTEIEVDKIDGLTIKWFGTNSVVRIHKTTNFRNCLFEIGSNNNISIGEKGFVNGLYLRMLASESQVKIGNKFIISSGEFILANKHKKQSIIIGDDCLFSSKIAFFTSDGHTIIDDIKGKILNSRNGTIVIGNHVWVGFGVCVLKNSTISDNSVIGAKSLINKAYQKSNVLIAGNPAKIIRKKINWSIQSPEEYEEQTKNKESLL